MVLKRLVIIVAGLVLLFVVVCPITPTPTAVVGGKAQVQIPAMAVVSLVLGTAPRLDHWQWPVASDPAPPVSSTDLIALTCVRLC